MCLDDFGDSPSNQANLHQELELLETSELIGWAFAEASEEEVHQAIESGDKQALIALILSKKGSKGQAVQRDIKKAEEDDDDDEQEELDSNIKHSCALALRDLMLGNGYSREDPEDYVDDELLVTRSPLQWAEILKAAIKEVAADDQAMGEASKQIERLCYSEFGAGAGFSASSRASLKMMRGKVTLWEALNRLPPEWAPTAQALQNIAQQQLFAVAGEVAFGGASLECLLRCGASFLRTDARGRVAAHIAAERESTLLGQIVLSAPAALLVEDEEGTTPLDVLSESPMLEHCGCWSTAAPDVLEALADAALTCLASLPEQTARVLKRSPSASASWAKLAKVPGGRGLLLAAWEEGAEDELGRLTCAAEEHEQGAAERLQQGMKRVLLLRSLAADAEQKTSDLEHEELQLRLHQAEQALQQRDEAAHQAQANLQREVKRLQTQLIEYEEELMALRSAAASQVYVAKERDAPMDPPADGQSRASGHSPTAKVKSRKAKAGAKNLAAAKSTEVEVLEEIRSSRMVGSDPAMLPLELRPSVMEMRESLTACVDRLARDLYESEAHFVQELVQNADDNKYDPDVIPTLRLVLHRSPSGTQAAGKFDTLPYFYAANNEIGMTEVDVRALCDISRSSKSLSDSTTTGHKGVGWKSVFRVCDKPHVLSGKWRFRFSTHGLGMLTPEVIDDAEYARLPEEIRQAHSSGLTVFYLPLASEQVAQSIQHEMETIESDAAQLLFLRRIRGLSLCGMAGRNSELSVISTGDVRTTTVCSRTSPGGVDGDVCARSETCFEISTHEEVTVALPLVEEPSPQRIYAFLPVRSVGFRFAVHAPFHLTASRADLHRSTENARRRNAVAPAFLKACQANEEVAAKALHFLGTEPAEPFWLSVHASILAGLQGVPCVMTDGGMLEPQRCLLRGEDPAVQWVPDQLLADACALVFASASNPQAAMRDLGVCTFGFDHLVACIQHDDGDWIKSMSRDQRCSAFFSDLYAALADALHAEPKRLEIVQNLHIFPLARECTGLNSALRSTMLNQLVLVSCQGLCSGLTDRVPKAWQYPLVQCLGDLEILPHGRKLLHLLGVERMDEDKLEQLALRCLLESGCRKAAECGVSVRSAHTAWAALAVLQRCYMLGRAPPRPWGELHNTIALPSASGELLPPRQLRPWSFMGVEEKLPRNVLQTIHSFADIRIGGLQLEQCSRERVAAPSWGRPSGDPVPWHIGWEVFLCVLGCVPLSPTSGDCSVEATMKLGKVLSSGEFWQNVCRSPATLQYVQRALREAGRTRRLWLRELPVLLEDGSVAALKDFFLHETFHSLAGAHLPYVVDAPSGARTFLSELGVSTVLDRKSLVKCLRWLQAHDVSDTGLMADIYGQLGQLGVKALGREPLVFAPGRGWLRPEACCWKAFTLPLLQRCSRLSSLSEHYERFGEAACAALQSWVIASAENDVQELCSALGQAVRCAKEEGQSVPSQEAAAGLFDASYHAVSAIARICAWEMEWIGVEMARFAEMGLDCPSCLCARGNFSSSRLIVVPDVHTPRTLWTAEAFWTVSPEYQNHPCAAYALGLHYGGSDELRDFFINVLGVLPELRMSDAQRWSRSQAPQQPTSSGVIEGLTMLQVSAPSAPTRLCNGSASPATGVATNGVPSGQGVPSSFQLAMHLARSAPPATSSAEALRLEGSGKRALPQVPRRRWNKVSEMHGFSIFAAAGSQISQSLWQQLPDAMLLARICSAFGLHPGQVGLAYDASGCCVCEDRLFLDISLARRIQPGWQSALVFWTSELAHAIAHLGCGPEHRAALNHLQSEILASMLPLVLQVDFAANNSASFQHQVHFPQHQQQWHRGNM
jgi:hypothetical protein